MDNTHGASPWLCVMFCVAMDAWRYPFCKKEVEEAATDNKFCLEGWWWWASPEECSSILLSSADSTPRHQEGLLRLCCMDKHYERILPDPDFWQDILKRARFFVWHSPRVDSKFYTSLWPILPQGSRLTCYSEHGTWRHHGHRNSSTKNAFGRRT